jgi:hypothetical protein
MEKLIMMLKELLVLMTLLNLMLVLPKLKLIYINSMNYLAWTKTP